MCIVSAVSTVLHHCYVA